MIPVERRLRTCIEAMMEHCGETARTLGRQTLALADEEAKAAPATPAPPSPSEGEWWVVGGGGSGDRPGGRTVGYCAALDFLPIPLAKSAAAWFKEGLHARPG
jgi:hypothetical protein